MFSQLSRYVNLTNIVTTDARDRSLESKQGRPPAGTSGSFLHRLEEGERLDHLAYKYYGHSQKWWLICDANPAFPSPLAMTGKEPVVTSRFTVTYNPGSDSPPWYKPVKALNRTAGIYNVLIDEEFQPVKEVREINGQPVEVFADRYKYVMTVTHNTLNISIETIKENIGKEGFAVVEMESIGRTGKQIVIPPDVVE